MHCISHLAYHAMFCIMLLAHCTMIDCWSFACVLALGRAWRQVRDPGTRGVCLRGSSFRQLGELCRQDDHTLEITSIFACYMLTLLLCLCYNTYHLLIMPPILPCQTSNPPCPSKPLFGYVTSLLSPSYSVASCR